MKLFWKILLWLVGIFAIGLIGVFFAFQISVKPGVYIIQHMFNQQVMITDEATFNQSSLLVDKVEDVTYTSDYNNNTFDIYYPNDLDDARPVLFWVHGGGFVAGDKEGVKEFSTYIVENNQIAVVAIDYEKAPYLQYPGQVKQLDDVYKYVRDNQVDFPMLDLSAVMFGGDSAGAQIAGQYTALQTNVAYANEMEFNQIVPEDSILSFISYSGPIDLQQMAEIETDNLFMKFFTNTVARAFIGKRDWKHSEELKQASVMEYITEDFPPTYITDGNTFSFQEQGIAFEEKLKTFNIPSKSLFFINEGKEISHEYQFNYQLDEAKESLQQTIDFINEQLQDEE